MGRASPPYRAAQWAVQRAMRTVGHNRSGAMFPRCDMPRRSWGARTRPLLVGKREGRRAKSSVERVALGVELGAVDHGAPSYRLLRGSSRTCP